MYEFKFNWKSCVALPRLVEHTAPVLSAASWQRRGAPGSRARTQGFRSGLLRTGL